MQHHILNLPCISTCSKLLTCMMSFKQTDHMRSSTLVAFKCTCPPPPSTVRQSCQAVFKLATDQSSGVRREVCIAFCQLVAVHPELLQAHLPQLVEYMLASNQVRAVWLF